MSLYSGISRYNHLSEFNEPLDMGDGRVLSAAARRALALANLWGGSNNAVDFAGPTGTGAASAGVLTFNTAETTIVVTDQLGRIDFKAGSEASGTDAILVGASIWAAAGAEFTASVNDTDLVFALGASETAAEKFRMTSDGLLQTTVGLGTLGVADGLVVEEQGWGDYHYTKIVCTAVPVGTSVESTDDSFGVLVYTLPVGEQIIDEATIYGSLDNGAGTDSDTPEVGLGTVIASTASATLSTTTEDIIDGGAAGGTYDADAVAPGLDGATDLFRKTNLSTVRPMFQTGGTKTVHFNIADGFAAGADTAITFTGIITLRWRQIN